MNVGDRAHDLVETADPVPKPAPSLIDVWRHRVVAAVDHEAVIVRIRDESGWSARYLFMTLMSAGIAVLGLLLSSPAVVIGAMLISPLMGPILGLGLSLALFDFKEMRRSLAAMAAGSLAAVLFAAVIVLASPLRTPTAEILARTRPNLFDLLVAVFASFAGTFAIIRGRGETIVGVAIATALMPPLAVVGYGLATWNLPVLSGSLALFATNLVAIALTASVMARFYGFGHALSSQQTWAQTLILALVFAAMSVPLGYSLKQIATEAVAATKIRNFLSDQFGEKARVTQLDVDFDRTPWSIRSVVIAPRARARPNSDLEKGLRKTLGRPVTLQVDQVLLGDRATSIEAQREELRQAETAQAKGTAGQDLARLVALAAGVPVDQVSLDADHQRILATAAPLSGAGVGVYRQLEQRAAAAAPGWTVQIVPPLSALPIVSFVPGGDAPDPAGQKAIADSVWATKRWNAGALGVPGLPESTPRTLAARRAANVAQVITSLGLEARPADGRSGEFRPVALGLAASSK